MGWFSRLKLANKILCAVLFGSALACVVGGYGLSVIRDMSDNAKEMYTNNIMSMQFIGNARMSLLVHQRANVRLLSLRDKEEGEATVGRGQQAWSAFEAALKKYGPLATT